jgi:hypothetical protein
MARCVDTSGQPASHCQALCAQVFGKTPSIPLAISSRIAAADDGDLWAVDEIWTSAGPPQHSGWRRRAAQLLGIGCFRVSNESPVGCVEPSTTGTGPLTVGILKTRIRSAPRHFHGSRGRHAKPGNPLGPPTRSATKPPTSFVDGARTAEESQIMGYARNPALGYPTLLP